jgi:hypothetical protein
MGQFLNEKHRAGMKNKALFIIKLQRASGKFCACLSSRSPKPIVSAIVMIINQLGKSVSTLISLPSHVRNFLSSTKVTLLKCRTRRGVPMSVNQNMMLDSTPKPLIVKAINMPNVIRVAKVRFQNLFLLSHLGCTDILERGRYVTSWLFELFIMFISNNGLKSYVNIVPEYTLCYKKIVQIATLCIISTSTCAVFADENEGEYSAQKIATLISQEEKKHLIPTGLLAAIAKIESSTRTLAVNIRGKSIIASSISDAKSIIQQKLEEGVTNIDIGVMQLNYRWHGKQFVNLEEMLNPQNNIAYAAKMLKALKDQYGDWQSAIRYYHSYTPVHNMAYSRKVTLCWLES